MNGYQLRLPGFEGPLDLLLQLIERRQMDVTTVSLAQATEQYLEYLWSMEGLDLDAWSSFLVVAARLLLIKSRRLLPGPARPEREGAAETEEDAGAALVLQLLELRRYRPAIALLRARDERGLRSYPRPPSPPRLLGDPLQGIDLSDLQAALLRVLGRLEPAPVVVPPAPVNVGDRVRSLQSILAGVGRTTLDRLLADCTSRSEVVVTFLALLEMIRQGRVVATQGLPFSDIQVELSIAPPIALG